MIKRYASKPIAALFSDQITYQRWYRIEVDVSQAQVQAELVPPWSMTPFVDIDWKEFTRAVHKEERKTHHDVQAFLNVCRRWNAPSEALPFLHYGLTSSNLVDTALTQTLQIVTERICAAINVSLYPPDGTEQQARTHGVPQGRSLTASARTSRHYIAMADALYVLRTATKNLRGSLAGPSGNFSKYLPEPVANDILFALNIAPSEAVSQCVPRLYYANWASAVASVSTALSAYALDLRLLLLPGVDEAHLSRPDATYRGSSAMPHKINPTQLERVCGLARLARHYAATLQESTELWLERDISHSAVERIVLPDLTHIVFQQVNDLIETIPLIDFQHTPYAIQARFPDSFAALHENIDLGVPRDVATERLIEASDERDNLL